MSLTRRQAIGTLAAQAVRRKPNFLFLIADDHAGYVLGADGNKQAETPNLDRLASEGTRFASHYCNSPVCTPSRQGLLTGLLPHAAGVTRLPTKLSDSRTTLAQQFRKAGYKTAVFGKMHFNQPGRPGLHGFDVCMTEDQINKGWQASGTPKPVEPGIATKPPWKPFRDPARIWLNADKLPYPRYAGQMRSDYCVGQALSFMEQQSGPFAMWVSLQEPHSPYDFPIEDRDRFSPATFQVPRVGPEDAWQIPKIFRDLSDDDKRGINAAYYTSVRFLDHSMGRVLKRLDELKLADNTLVVYLADHGYSLGQHGRFEKHCGYDPALRVPLIFRWPGKVQQRTVIDLTEHIDVAPTITELLQLEPMPGAQGHSLLTGPKRSSIFSEYLENEEAFVRTNRWKYIFCTGKRKRGDGYETDNPTPGRYQRLYDLKADPGEFTDVAAKNPETVAQLQSLMLERFRTTHPDAANEPGLGGKEAALEFYLRPRDDA